MEAGRWFSTWGTRVLTRRPSFDSEAREESREKAREARGCKLFAGRSLPTLTHRKPCLTPEVIVHATNFGQTPGIISLSFELVRGINQLRAKLTTRRMSCHINGFAKVVSHLN